MDDAFLGQGRPARRQNLGAVAPGNRQRPGQAAGLGKIGGSQHRQHAGRVFRGCHVDAAYVGRRHRRPHEDGMRLTRFARIGGVAALALEQGLVLDAKLARAFHSLVSR